MMRKRSGRIGELHAVVAGMSVRPLGFLAAAVLCLTLAGPRAFAQPGVSDASQASPPGSDGTVDVQLAVTVTSASENQTFDITEVQIPGIASTDYTDCNCGSASTGALSGLFGSFFYGFAWNDDSLWAIDLYWSLYDPSVSWPACTACLSCTNPTGFDYSYELYDWVFTEIDVSVY